MKGFIFGFLLVLPSLSNANEALKASLEGSYSIWRDSMVKKDYRVWQQVTAAHRQVEVRNRIVSEKLPFPSSIFHLPAEPPVLHGLKFLSISRSGPTAKAIYFGKVNFGVGGEPTENLLVLSFVQGANRFLYDKAEYVNLTALPDVRKELAAGDLSYLEGVPEAKASGVVPPTPVVVQPATIIAKVYVFCPGREVEVMVNKVSRHKFINGKEAETVIGGARDGVNEVQYAIRKLDEGKGDEAMTIRVYLLSEIQGVKPIKAFEYQVGEKGAVSAHGSGSFIVDQATLKMLKGK
ncbi:MAG: hypothetical protein RL346_57 [Verrucomicrobiota bacterium]|jgi:hypothetical protein